MFFCIFCICRWRSKIGEFRKTQNRIFRKIEKNNQQFEHCETTRANEIMRLFPITLSSPWKYIIISVNVWDDWWYIDDILMIHMTLCKISTIVLLFVGAERPCFVLWGYRALSKNTKPHTLTHNSLKRLLFQGQHSGLFACACGRTSIESPYRYWVIPNQSWQVKVTSS